MPAESPPHSEGNYTCCIQSKLTHFLGFGIVGNSSVINRTQVGEGEEKVIEKETTQLQLSPVPTVSLQACLYPQTCEAATTNATPNLPQKRLG